MKKYTLSTIISLSCMISTMQLQTSQQRAKSTSPDQVYTNPNFNTRLTFSPNRPLLVEEAPITVDNRHLMSTTQPLSVHPAQIQNEIEDLIIHYTFNGIQDPQILADKVFKRVVTVYRVDSSGREKLQEIIQNEINSLPAPMLNSASAGNTTETSIITALKSFINSQVQTFRRETNDPARLKEFITDNMLQAFNLSGNDRASLLQFATNYLEQEIELSLQRAPTPAPKNFATPAISNKLKPNESTLNAFISTQIKNHMDRIHKGLEGVPAGLPLQLYVNFLVKNDIFNTYDFSEVYTPLQRFALTTLDNRIADLVPVSITPVATTPNITSPVITAPRAERMAQTPRPEGSYEEESPVSVRNYPQTTGFGSLAHPRLSPTTTSLEPSSAIPEFSVELSPTMDKKTPTTELLLQFIYNQIAEKRSEFPNLETLSQVIENEIINTFDFSGAQAKKQQLADFALQELDIAISDLNFEENQPTNISPAATADLEPSPTTSESNVETQAHSHSPSLPIAIARAQASETSTYQTHSLRSEQPYEHEYKSTLPTTPSLKTSTAARTLLNQVAQNIIQQQPTIQTDDLRDMLLSVADENELDNYSQVITEITANHTQQLEAKRQAALGHLTRIFAPSSDRSRILPYNPAKSKI